MRNIAAESPTGKLAVTMRMNDFISADIALDGSDDITSALGGLQDCIGALTQEKRTCVEIVNKHLYIQNKYRHWIET